MPKTNHQSASATNARRIRTAKHKGGCLQGIVRRGWWTVYHPDGEELGLLPVWFKHERMARQSARLWNKKYPGHRVVAPNDQAHL